MAEITVFPHGDRWAVAEPGAESPTKEFPTREAAELAARQMGGEVRVLDEDPTGLEHSEPGDAGQAPGGPTESTMPVESGESPRLEQPGL
jgi:hypothetical protein